MQKGRYVEFFFLLSSIQSHFILVMHRKRGTETRFFLYKHSFLSLTREFALCFFFCLSGPPFLFVFIHLLPLSCLSGSPFLFVFIHLLPLSCRVSVGISAVNCSAVCGSAIVDCPPFTTTPHLNAGKLRFGTDSLSKRFQV